MKKLLFLWVLVLTTFSLKAQSKVLIGDLYYNLYDDNTAEVTAPTSGEYGNLNNLIIPASVEHEGVSYAVTSIGNDAFYSCYALTSITIPESVTSIEYGAFNGCTSLTSITIPNSVTSIGDDAFSDCDALTSIIIPESVTSIGWGTFSFCNALTSISIPESVTSIGDNAFSSCTSLTSVTIPNSVTSIGEWAFDGCDALTSVTIEANTPPTIGTNLFTSNPVCTIPCGTLTAYQASDWAQYVSEFVEEDSTGKKITYTSTDGEIVTPYNTDDFGANIVSNTYENGVGTITFDDPVTSIGNDAFRNCSGLTSITIPKSVTSIGYSAFNNCSSLTSIIIPKSVTSIGDYAFSDCDALTSIIIPKSVTSIGNRAFYDCESLTSIIIPNSVTSIGDDAFSDCTSLTSITIPKSVTSIGSSAFSGCTSLTSITIPESVTSIGSWAFSGCTSLTSITIPESVTSIGTWAFDGCKALTSITIPESVTSIGNSAFSNCNALSSIVVAEGNPNYDSRGNCNAIIETATNTLISGCKSTIIPESVTSIGDYAFEECALLTSITIHNSVTSIGNYAFRGCRSLTSVTIPNSVISIGNWAFSSCSSLTSVTIPNSVTSIRDYAFYNCNALTSITIPESVTNIGEQAFRACSSLTSITIPNSVTSIGQSAFSRCTSLTSVTIEANTPPTIGTDLFSSNPVCTIPCGTLTAYQASDWAQYVSEFVEEGCEEPIDPTWQILYTSTNGKIVTPNATKVFGANIVNNTYENGVGTITFDGPVTSIGNYAFYDCNALTSVTIPNSVISIGSHAFWGCWSLTSITIPESVTSIGDYAFICYKLTSIIIPNSVTSIGENAFWSCYALTSVTIGESVTSIGEQAFSDCDALNSIVVAEGNPNYDSRGNCNAIIETATNTLISGCKSTIIPNSVTSIGNYAFYDCDALTSITIPNSVTSIGGSAFSSCGALTSITIPESVTSIGVAAFSACIALTSITIPESVTSIGKLAFSSCRSLTSITIPESVTSIGEKAFTSCDALNSIVVAERNSNYDSRGNCNAIIETATNTLISGCKSTIIPESVTSIGYSAFEECESLTSITIPESVTSIRSNAFSYCYALTSVTIGENVTSIGDYAFLDCESLTSIIIPKSVTSIGSHAFYIPNLKVCCEGDAPATIESSVFKSNAKIYVPNVEEYKTAWSTYASQITSAEFTYTLFGDAALGLSMDANNAAQQMQLQSVGTYTLSKTDISLSEGTYSYTARRTSEAPCFEPEDITSTLSITTAGKYDITFTLNPATDELTAQVTLKEPEQLNQPDKLYFHPSTVWKEAGARFAAHFLSTTNESWVNMSDADGDGIYEVENPKTYNQIRFCRIDPNATSENISNNVWQATNTLQIPNNDNALNTCYAFYKNDWSLDGTWVVPTPLTANNCWTIINTYQDQTINIVVERQFFDIGDWYTLCLPFSCNASIFGEAHQFASLDVANDIVTIMTSLHNTIEAGAPYLFKPLSSYDHFIVENVKIPSFVTPQTISVSGGGFTISLTSVLQTEGTTDDAYWIGSGGYLYNNDVDKLGLRAYFNISKPAGMAPRFRVSTSEENATGFDILIDKENHTMKILENGQLVILRNGEKYNIQGQKL